MAADAFAQVREVLVDRHATHVAGVLADDALAEVAVTITDARQRIAEWPIACKDFALVQESLHRNLQARLQHKGSGLRRPSLIPFHELPIRTQSNTRLFVRL